MARAIVLTSCGGKMDKEHGIVSCSVRFDVGPSNNNFPKMANLQYIRPLWPWKVGQIKEDPGDTLNGC